jgi:hypothetical protein
MTRTIGLFKPDPVQLKGFLAAQKRRRMCKTTAPQGDYDCGERRRREVEFDHGVMTAIGSSPLARSLDNKLVNPNPGEIRL